ncbi:hypothetical protein [Streptomyces sp. NBC_01224]|uniref:hypothetical protein n=1 Tax=Streptomyces sp. NBC_01224 TaxID=2903783 RepID=UPI002E10F99B
MPDQRPELRDQPRRPAGNPPVVLPDPAVMNAPLRSHAPTTMLPVPEPTCPEISSCGAGSDDFPADRLRIRGDVPHPPPEVALTVGQHHAYANSNRTYA